MFGDLLKATIGVATLPVKVVADMATLGGVITDKDKPYTVKGVENILKNIDNATEPDRK